MPDSQLPVDQVILPTLVLGPRSAEGRDFQILAHSDAMAGLNPDEKALLYDLPLALSAWAAERGDETDIVACIPLGPKPAPQIVLRAVELGQTGIGSLVYGNAIVLSAAMAKQIGQAPERLLPFIPLPDGTTGFAQQPMAIPLAHIPAFPQVAWPGLGLAWRNRLIRIDHAAQRENALCSALTSIEPPGQRERVRGWTTSAKMVGIGNFNPARAFQCIVTNEPSAADTGGRYLDYAITNAGPVGATALPPQVFDSWQGFARLFGNNDQAVPAWAQWRAEYATLDADSLYASLTARAEAVLEANDLHALIVALASRAISDGADAASDAAAMGRAARTAFWQRVQRNASTEERKEALDTANAVLAAPQAVALALFDRQFNVLPAYVASKLTPRGQSLLIDAGLAHAAMNRMIDPYHATCVVNLLANRPETLKKHAPGSAYFGYWLAAAMPDGTAHPDLVNIKVHKAADLLGLGSSLVAPFTRIARASLNAKSALNGVLYTLAGLAQMKRGTIG